MIEQIINGSLITPIICNDNDSFSIYPLNKIVWEKTYLYLIAILYLVKKINVKYSMKLQKYTKNEI